MYKAVLILGIFATVFVYEASCQRFIHPTYRPPPKRPVTYRFRRDADEPPPPPKRPVTYRFRRDADEPPPPPKRPVTYRFRRDTDDIDPPPKRPVTYRFRRDADEPQWLYKGDDVQRAPATGDHPFLPNYIDDIKLDPHTRVARSLGTPRATGSGGNHGTRQSSNRDTGPTHPGYNRRNARSLPVIPKWPTLPPFNPHLPGPKHPWDSNPGRIPIYV